MLYNQIMIGGADNPRHIKKDWYNRKQVKKRIAHHPDSGKHKGYNRPAKNMKGGLFSLAYLSGFIAVQGNFMRLTELTLKWVKIPMFECLQCCG
ncbi:MAG: hypothetical protein AAF639_11585 [Chloroflexota bacterium]